MHSSLYAGTIVGLHPGMQPSDLAALMEGILDMRDARPTVRLHRWLDRREAGHIKLADSFERFDKLLRSFSIVSPSSRAYWFPVGSVKIDSRIELTASSFAAFCDYVRGDDEAAIWIYDGAAAQTSPDQLPAIRHVEPAERATPSQPSQRSGRSGRSSAVQEQFRSAVLGRDGRNCVLCGRESTEQELDAAHIIPHGAPSAVMLEAGLTSTNECCNGVMLCSSPCHFWFDQLHWWLGEDGNVCATEAILSDAELGLHFTPLVGKPLRLPSNPVFSPLWPPALTWAVQRRRCVENTEKRRVSASAAKFFCEKCGTPYIKARAYTNHVARCTASTRRVLFTPVAALCDDDDVSSSGDDGDGT